MYKSKDMGKPKICRNCKEEDIFTETWYHGDITYKCPNCNKIYLWNPFEVEYQ